MNKDNSTSKGIGFVGLLQIVFIVLKLCGVIDWKWVWVLAPAWIDIGLAIIFLIIFAVISVLREEKKENE